jgi:hypothetical protein
VNQAPSASPSIDDDKSKDKADMHDKSDKKTGLDRADEAAGEHGKQGRDNARSRGNR